MQSNTTRHLFGASISNFPTMFVTGAQGTVLRSTDAGNSWHPRSVGTAQHLHAVHGIGTIVYVVGSFGTVLLSTDLGQSWTPRFSGTTAAIRGVMTLSNTDCIIVGDAGQLRTSTNQGQTWVLRTLGMTRNFLDIDAHGGAAVFVSGDSGTVLRSTDAGVTWSVGNTGFFTNHTGIAFATPLVGVMVGRRGSIGRTTDGGVTWRGVPAVTTQDLTAVSFGDSLTGGACGTGGVIIHTTDAGATWSQQYSPVTTTLRAIAFDGPFNGLAVGDNGVLLRTINGGVPVELATFSARRGADRVHLAWTTESERANAGFQLERRIAAADASPGGGGWHLRATLPGAGTTLARQSYRFDDDIHPAREGDTLVYRLRQRDLDGTESLSHELVLAPEADAAPATVRIAGAHPIRSDLVLAVNLAEPGDVQIVLADASGRIVAQTREPALGAGTHIVRIAVAHLPAGSYVSLVTAGGRTHALPIRIIH
jgi:photosystem II stability/assembly factor-like uncharacterized protein